MSDPSQTETDSETGGSERHSGWYRELVEEANDVTVVVDADGTMTYASPAVERFSGYDPAELTGEDAFEYVHPEDSTVFLDAIETLRATSTDAETVEFRWKRADGTWCWLEASMRDRLDTEVDGIILNGRDITGRKERETELRATKERMKMALEGANLGIWDWDMETDEVVRDELLTEMLGYTRSEMGDHLDDWERVVHPDGKTRHDEALAEHIENRTPYYQCEYRLETKSGDWKWVRTMGKVVDRDETGEPIRAVGIHQDIDDRKRAELALEAERDMFKEGPAVVFKWEDTEGWPITYVSENVESVFGYPADELRSNELVYADLVHDEDLDRIEREMAEYDEEGTDLFSPDPYRVITANGEVRWVMEHTKDLQEGGEGNHLLGYIVDITERKRRERELQRFKSAVDQSAHAIYMTDVDGTIEYVNPAFETVTGYSEAEAVGATPRILQSGEYSETFYENFWETILSGDRWEAEILDERADGEEIVLNQTVAPITDEDGEIRKFVAVARDITERKMYEEALEAREEKYRNLFEDTRDALMLMDRDGYLDCNERALELFGVESVDAFVDYTPWELSPSTQPDGTDSQEAALERINEAFEEGEAFFEWTHQRVDDGTEFPAEVKLSRFEYDGGPVVHALVRDITVRKERERELEAREEKYRNLFDDTRDALMLLDRDGFFDCNERALELFGVESVDAFVDYTPWGLAPPTQPDGSDSKETALKHVETAFEEGEAFFEWTHQRVDGTEFPAEVKLSRFEHQGDPALHALVRDITERKEYERQLEEQRDNLDVLNQVLRHDIRNDIQLIMAYAELLEEECDDEALHDDIEMVLESADHAVELTNSAREMADVLLSTDEELQDVDLRTVLEGEIQEVQSAYPELELTRETTIPQTSVQANSMLGSIFRNLLKNAVQHNDKETPRVAVSATDSGETVVVRIADNGPGIPDAQKDAIFGKGEKGLDSQGTGIGLYLVKTLLESYSGDVWVEDRADHSPPDERSDTDDRTERHATDSRETPDDDREGAVFVVELPKVELT